MAKVLTQRTVEFAGEEVLEILMKEALKSLDRDGIEMEASDVKISWSGAGQGGIKVTLSEKDTREKTDE
jgi:hypothetical protein